MEPHPYERDFKGVWIPKDIWLSRELSLMEKVLFVEIHSLDNERGCFASNRHFAEFFDVSDRQIRTYVGTLKDTDWDHLLMHVCERHLPGSFAFAGAKAAATPINHNNTQFPPDWTPQDIADLLRKALASPEGKHALQLLEADAEQAEKATRWAEWDYLTKSYAAWQKRADRYDQWLDRDEWWNNGGQRWTTYQKVLARGEKWNSRHVPTDPGPEPPRVPDHWGNPPGDEPELPGPEPEYAVAPKWDPQRFWYDGVEFKVGADFRDGVRQITQLFPVQSLGDPPLKAFSEFDMTTLRDAMIG